MTPKQMKFIIALLIGLLLAVFADVSGYVDVPVLNFQPKKGETGQPIVHGDEDGFIFLV